MRQGASAFPYLPGGQADVAEHVFPPDEHRRRFAFSPFKKFLKPVSFERHGTFPLASGTLP